MDLLADYGLFFAKLVTVAAVLLGGLALLAAARRGGAGADGRLEWRHWNAKLRAYRRSLGGKAARERRRRRGKTRPPHAWVLRFEGDLRAAAVDDLREEVSAVLSLAREGDRVVAVIDSAGGWVHGYGLAAAQLQRIRERGLPLTACIDRIAASGGYLMACVADRILAAPFAVTGSIGVVAGLPNVHRLLERHDIDYELFTAGEHKRTVTVFGRNTDRGRAKFQAQLDALHGLFKRFVAEHRPQLDIERVATGEAWFGRQAVELGLVDALQTSDDHLMRLCEEGVEVYELRHRRPKPLAQRLGLDGALGRSGWPGPV
ncbi:MAG: hypothetical protein KatS3mg121_1174 [Gammaproteobacteria bacterium]|nr:MAG: hypothetical protein KatS3mg121_1174 [Gammaproteobacteria bacterium]